MKNPGRSSAVLLATFLTAALGCAIGPIWAKRLEGRVVNAETGEPVEGAEVFQWYSVMGGDLTYNFGHRWATTDEEGRFAISGHVALTLGPPFTFTEEYPHVEVVHPGLETVQLFTWEEDPDHPRTFPGWQELELAVEPRRTPHLFESVRKWSSLCRLLSSEACDRMCGVAYGSAEACYEQGRPR